LFPLLSTPMKSAPGRYCASPSAWCCTKTFPNRYPQTKCGYYTSKLQGQVSDSSQADSHGQDAFTWRYRCSRTISLFASALEVLQSLLISSPQKQSSGSEDQTLDSRCDDDQGSSVETLVARLARVFCFCRWALTCS
jgi:hypothetical protein